VFRALVLSKAIAAKTSGVNLVPPNSSIKIGNLLYTMSRDITPNKPFDETDSPQNRLTEVFTKAQEHFFSALDKYNLDQLAAKDGTKSSKSKPLQQN
jgi:DNA-binding IscR family transcriptional regulator